MANTTNSETARENRERWPEFASIVDGLKGVLGEDSVKVVYVRFPDGKEIGRKP